MLRSAPLTRNRAGAEEGTMDALSQETIAILGVGVVLAGFFWSLHRDVAGLRERVSRLEGLYEGLRDSVARLQESVGDLSKSVGELRESVAGLQVSVRRLEERFDRLEQRFDDRFPPPSAADD